MSINFPKPVVSNRCFTVLASEILGDDGEAAP